MDTVALIDGMALTICPEYLHFRSCIPLRTVTTAPLGGELRVATDFLSVPAPRDLACFDPETVIGYTAEALGIIGPLVGFMTAVKLTNACVAVERDDERAVVAIATVGVGNASRPGESRHEGYASGTINLIVAIDADLSEAALHESLALAAEAKALAVMEAGVRTAAGRLATGTSTDAYAIACTGRGPHEPYAGAVTPVGYLVGRAVTRAVSEGLGPALARVAAAASAAGPA